MTETQLDESQFDNVLLNIWKRERANPAVKYSTGDYRSGDEAPEHLRSLMPEPFRDVPLSRIRKAIHRLTGTVNGSRKRNGNTKDPIERARKILGNVPNTEYSEEYLSYIAGDVWRERSSEHKRLCDYRCQLCSRIRLGRDLQVHHIIYPDEFAGTERTVDLLCLCGRPCHDVADGLRRWGKQQDQKCPHGNDPSECESCFVKSDFEYDSMRERSFFG